MTRREFITLLGGAAALPRAGRLLAGIRNGVFGGDEHDQVSEADGACSFTSAVQRAVADQLLTHGEIIVRIRNVLDEPHLSEALGLRQNRWITFRSDLAYRKMAATVPERVQTMRVSRLCPIVPLIYSDHASSASAQVIQHRLRLRLLLRPGGLC